MARKRMIDPSIWQDEEFGSLTALAKVLFIGLFSNADDEGRIRANPAFLKSTVFMYDNLDIIKIKETRDEVIQKIKSVKFYEVDGKEYIQLANWSEYQHLRKERIQPSSLPAYVSQSPSDDSKKRRSVGIDKVSIDKISIDIVAQNEQPQTGIKKYERKPIDKQTLVQRLGYFLEDTLNTNIVVWGKQAKAVDMMVKAGYTEEQIKKAIVYMAKQDEFFTDKGFDLMTVANNIARLKAKANKGKTYADK